MSGKTRGLHQLILLVLMCVGGWLALDSGVRFLIGLILIFGSATWLLLLIKVRLSQPKTKGEAKVWGKVSEGGKGKYIRKAIIMGSLLGVASNSILMFESFKV